MQLYGIRKIYDGTVYPMCILAEAKLGGETGPGLSSKIYLEITAGISLTTGRKTLFVTEDLHFVATLFFTGTAWDYKEYFEFSGSNPNTTYEIYDVITGQKVEVDLDDPAFSDIKETMKLLHEQKENRDEK
jgi:hypothetical protein